MPEHDSDDDGGRGMSGYRITHAQPLQPVGDGRFVANPLLTQDEAALEAALLTPPIEGEFGSLDEIEYGLYTHRMRVTSGPEHVCEAYLIRIVKT